MYFCGKEVERVQEYKYLGTVFDATLTENSEAKERKGHFIIHILRVSWGFLFYDGYDSIHHFL